MAHVINIHNNGQEIDLETGKYKIDILGGWGVEMGQFSISFRHKQSGQIVNCKRSWPVQSFAFHKRTRRILSVDILERGTYKIEIANAETLQVKKTNLFFTRLFQDPIPNEDIFIFIH